MTDTRHEPPSRQPATTWRAGPALWIPLWLSLALLLFWIAPPPPEAPIVSAQEDALLQPRALTNSWRTAQRWQAERGDHHIPWEQARGHVALLIDDVGRELHWFEQLLALRYPLTFSVLPGAAYSAGAQLRLRADPRREREIWLHLPTEPLDPQHMRAVDEQGEDFLLASDGPARLRSKLAAALERVPLAVGVNNHMGSRLTAQRASMDALMLELHQRGLLFLDSLTGPDSQAYAAALAAAVPAARRDIFLDHVPERAAIRARLEEAAARSLERPVVVIGHPSQELVDVLRAELDGLHRRGIGVYALSELITRAAGEPARPASPRPE